MWYFGSIVNYVVKNTNKPLKTPTNTNKNTKKPTNYHSQYQPNYPKISPINSPRHPDAKTMWYVGSIVNYVVKNTKNN